MANSIRERILQAVIGILAPVAAAAGAELRRSPVTGMTREQSPALLVFPESDSILQRPNNRVERQLALRLVVLARESGQGGGEAPEVTADRLLVAAHIALMSDVNLGNLCLGIHELDCEWEVEDADATAAAIPARYQIRYRTLAADISVQG